MYAPIANVTNRASTVSRLRAVFYYKFIRTQITHTPRDSAGLRPVFLNTRSTRAYGKKLRDLPRKGDLRKNSSRGRGPLVRGEPKGERWKSGPRFIGHQESHKSLKGDRPLRHPHTHPRPPHTRHPHTRHPHTRKVRRRHPSPKLHDGSRQDGSTTKSRGGRRINGGCHPRRRRSRHPRIRSVNECHPCRKRNQKNRHQPAFGRCCEPL